MYRPRLESPGRDAALNEWLTVAGIEDLEVLATAVECGPLRSLPDTMLEALEPIAQRFEQWCEKRCQDQSTVGTMP